MKALGRCILGAAAAVLLLAAALAFLTLRPSPQSEQGVIFSDVEPVDVAAVAVQNDTGSYRFYYEDDGYVLDDIPGNIADLDVFIAFMTNCGRLSALRQVAEEPLPEYGLEAPAATATIEFFEGEPLQLSIGAQEAISEGYYAAVEGYPGVYLMAKSLAEPFLAPKTQIISSTVTPALGVSSPLSAIRDITFTGGPLESPVTIQATSGGDEAVRLAALSFGTATHIVRGAGVFQLDQTYGVELLGSLFGIASTGIEGYNLTQTETDALGFDEPWMSLEYDMVNGAEAAEEHCLLQVVKLEDSAYLAMLNNSGLVYRLGPQPFMDLQYDKLLLRWFLTPLLMDLSAVSVEGDGEEYRFDIDNTDSLNPIVTHEGEEVDIEGFRALFRLLTSAAHDGAYLGELEQPEGSPALTVTYEYIDPDKAHDAMTLYPGEVRRDNVFVNGAGEFAMKDSFAQRALEGCGQLLAGGPIEENW